MRDTIELKALAKINLGLDVLGKRENGYHDVRMVMQTIYLYDTVTMRRLNEEEISGKSQIQVETNLFYLPTNENNLAYRAAKMLIDEFEMKKGVHIALEKHIPVSAGMAGGSANAAAVLVGMNRLFSLGLTEKDLMERGVSLGADVPYCIMRGTVLAEGIGEILTPLPPLPRCFVLVAKPGISVSTKAVYEKLDARTIEEHPDIDGILEGLQKQDITKVAAAMGNVLEYVTVEDYPIIEQIKNEMKQAGALNAMMSGSGPTVFGIFEDRKMAKEAKKRLQAMKLAKQIYLANVHNIRRK